MNRNSPVPEPTEILDLRRLREALWRARAIRRRRIAIVALAMALVLAFATSLLLWEDDGRRCAKEELIGTQEVCTRWETREGLHYQRVE